MTRKSVYTGALAAFLAGQSDQPLIIVERADFSFFAATAMTLASVIIPRWISWDLSSVSEVIILLPSYNNLDLCALVRTYTNTGTTY